MALFYDLHIHSALSPCGDDDMTPNNIVNMAVIKGLDIIAVTDHNSANNLHAIHEVAKKSGIMLIPGLEVQTREEAHMLCYFKTLDSATTFGSIIYNSLPYIKNNPDIFGNQHIFDGSDNITGCVEKLLLSSSDFSIAGLMELVEQFGGACIPAHIDRPSYSIISNLGFIPESLNIKTVEISSAMTPASSISKFPYIKGMNIIKSSDAHYLPDISERENSLPVDELTMSGIFDYLEGKK